MAIPSFTLALAAAILIPTSLACSGGGGAGAPDSGFVFGDSGTTPSQELWNLPGGVDAVSLRLNEATMTFSWGISGCDFFGGDQGLIERNGNAFTLTPEVGMSTFTWVSGGSFGNEVATLTATIDGELDFLDVRGQVGGSTVIQNWERGGSCPVCGDDLGPSGKVECNDPFLGL